MKTHLYVIGAMVAWMSFNTTLKAQVEQNIVVTEYNGKEVKTPLSEVGVTVLNAGAAMSDQEGKATLRFRTLHAGDKVTIRRIEKAGYEIFNSMAIDQWNVSPNRPFQIILCRADKFKALRDQYSRVASDSYAKQYKAEMARLNAERKKTKMLEADYQQKMLDLENQYQQQLEDLENYVDQFARIDLSELNNQQQELINLVQKGKIEEAIQKYESADYQAQYEKQCAEIAKIDRAQAQLAVIEAKKRSEREDVYKTISRQIATYRLAGGRENFNKVNALMKGVADADTTNLEAVFAYAEHAMHQNLIEDCEKYFNIYVRACKEQPALEASAWALLGQGFMVQLNYPKAEEAYLKAMKIRESLYQSEPERYAAALLHIQNKLSTYLLWVGKDQEAKEILEKAIPLCETLFKEEAEEYQATLSELYGNESLCLLNAGNQEAAIANANKACELARPLNQNTSESATPLITALDQQGGIYYSAGMWNEFIISTKELIEVDQNLYNSNPQEMLPFLQAAYNNLADGYLHLKDYTNCESNLAKAEGLLNEMIEKDRDPHHLDKFNLYEIAVRLYHEQGNQEKKKFYLDAAKAAFEQMVSEDKEQCKEMMEGLKSL